MAKNLAKENSSLPTKEQILAVLESDKSIEGKRDLMRAFNIKGKMRFPFKQLLREMRKEGLLKNSLSKNKNYLPSITVLTIPIDADPENMLAFPLNWNEELSARPEIIIKNPLSSRHSSPAPAPGDNILAKISYDTENNQYIAKVMKILPKIKGKQIGIVRIRNGQSFLSPIMRKQREIEIINNLEARDGDLVEVELTGKVGLREKRAKISKIIGNPRSEGAISLIAIYNHEIPHIFPDSVIKEAEKLTSQTMDNREDWRDIPFVTIDPKDAKDHDDAVFAKIDESEENKGGYIIYVAIADVAFYVKSGSSIDKEAYLRGNSVYFPDRVVPMLPEKISNNLCSLVENEQRAAIGLKIIINKYGQKISHSFHRVIIRSVAKLSYQQAQNAIDGSFSGLDKNIINNILKPLWRAYNLLLLEKKKRSPLELDLPERKIELDKNGLVRRVFVPPRLEAHKLIEEIMISANVCAAQTLEEQKSTLLYRVHDRPGEEKLVALREFLSSLKLPFLKSEAIRVEHFNQTLKKAKQSDISEQVSEMVLRSQSQAEYSPINIGHFGLNLAKYAHFTSPIRRYSDLIIHRLLISALKLGKDGISKLDIERMAQIGQHLSFTERRAMAAERETNDRLIAIFMSDKINATFKGRISGVTNAGLFVRLNETGADGFVRASTIGDDYYHYIEEEQSLIGEKSGERFRLGDEIIVRLVEVSELQGDMRFEIISKGEIVKPLNKISKRAKYSHKRRYSGRKRGKRK